VWLALKVSRYDVAAFPFLDIEETLEQGPLTYDIWYKLSSAFK
jgi:hypothetical protein